MKHKDYEPANFGELTWRARTLYPDKVAVEQGDLVLTYRELEERTRRAAALVAALGIVKGDRVLLLFQNDYRYAEALLGTLRTGAVAVPVNIKLGRDQLAYIAEHSEAVAAIGHDHLLANVPARRHMLAIDGGYDEQLEAAPAEFETVDVNPERDEALLMYTSGCFR